MRRLASSLPVVAALTLIAASWLAGCATTEPQRFPIDYASGVEATYQPETAREAFLAYQRMGADLERRGQFGGAAVAYRSAAVNALSLGRLQDALELSQQAVTMAERTGRPRHLAFAYSTLGQAETSLGAPQKAIPALKQAIRFGQEAGNIQNQAVDYAALSEAYRRLGDRAAAAENAAKALELLEAALPTLTEQLKSSGTRGQRQLSHLERIYGRALVEVGRSELALNHWESARAAFERSLAVGQRNQLPGIMGLAHQGLAVVANRTRDFPSAVIHLQEAQRLNPRPVTLAWSQATLGRAYRGMGKLPEAEEALRRAVAGYEDLRSLLGSEELRESFFEDKSETYELLVLTLLGLGKTSEAFDVGERARSRAFLDLLGSRVRLSRGRSQSLIAEERALRERISALKAQPDDSPALPQELERAREAYQAFLQRVRQLDGEQASLMTVEPLTLPEVQGLLPEGAVLLEYFLTGQGVTLLWTVEREQVSVATLRIGRPVVVQRVQAFRELIASRERQSDAQRMAQALYNQLVRPGLRQRTPKALIIVPHDVLHYLPFQALMPAPDRYLIQDAPVSYYSSASLMRFTREKQQAAAARALAVGNPDLGSPTLDLPYAEREVREVARLFPGTTVLIREEATVSRTRSHLDGRSLIHLATHAELDGRDPMGSALLLHPEGNDDGRLEVQEIFGLDLHASLVVLSACETALGTLTRGDEIAGLTRAFIYAGTPSVITTLWEVSDRASYELMRDFYGNLAAGQGKAEALRQAQLATLAAFPHPYYWAAYELIGEPR